MNDSVTEVSGAWIKDQRVVMKATFTGKVKAPARKR